MQKEDIELQVAYEIIKGLTPAVFSSFSDDDLQKIGGYECKFTQFKLKKSVEESIIILQTLERLGFIEYKGMEGEKRDLNPATGLIEKVPLLKVKLMRIVDPKSIIDDKKNSSLHISFNGQLCALKYGERIIHKPRRGGCSGKLLKELWTNRGGSKKGGLLQPIEELCRKTGYKNEGSLHNEITKIEKRITKAGAPIKIEQQSGGYMMLIE